MANAMGGVNRATSSLSKTFRSFQGILTGWVSYLGVREIVGFSDAMQNLNNRLVTITGSQAAASDTLEKLARVARDTNSSIDGTAEAYSRLAVALKGAGVDNAVLVDFTKTLINTFRLSGSTINETTATIVQLSQAFSSGQLRGQELRSVMEQNATVAGILRKEFGKDIYKKAAEGAIGVADVFRALFKHMDSINKQAEKLTPTISQTLTKAMNGLKITLLGLNQAFDVSGNFAKFVDYAIQKLPLMGVIVSAMALTQIPALVASLEGLGRAFLAMNVYSGIFLSMSVAVAVLIDKFYGLEKAGLKATQMMAQFFSITQQANAYFYKTLAAMSGPNNPFTNFGQAADMYQQNADNLKKFGSYMQDEVNNYKRNNLVEVVETEQDKIRKAYEQSIKNLEKFYGKQKEKIPKIKELLAELNKTFLSGAISADEYARRFNKFNFDKLNIEFKTGKLSLDAYNKGLEELNRQEINREFKDGYRSVQDFNDAIAESRLRDLNTDLQSGKISLLEFRMEFTKISEQFSLKGSLHAGVASYLQSIGTIGQQTAAVITSAFTQLEDVLLDFTKTGQFNFEKMTQAILDDLTRIIIRASIIRPLAQGILDFTAPATSGSVGGGGGQYPMPAQAKGGVWDRGVQKFARGGVVNRPTLFSHANGTGMMGEAGPEAILPLTRGKGGSLGVQATVTPVTVNIINQSGADVQQQESTGPNGERMIDILIANKVKEQLSNGTFDKAMSASYGLRRRGH